MLRDAETLLGLTECHGHSRRETPYLCRAPGDQFPKVSPEADVPLYGGDPGWGLTFPITQTVAG